MDFGFVWKFVKVVNSISQYVYDTLNGKQFVNNLTLLPTVVVCELYWQFREFLSSYNRLSELCFTDCVHDMTTRKVLDSEVPFSTVTVAYSQISVYIMLIINFCNFSFLAAEHSCRLHYLVSIQEKFICFFCIYSWNKLHISGRLNVYLY